MPTAVLDHANESNRWSNERPPSRREPARFPRQRPAINGKGGEAPGPRTRRRSAAPPSVLEGERPAGDGGMIAGGVDALGDDFHLEGGAQVAHVAGGVDGADVEGVEA